VKVRRTRDDKRTIWYVWADRLEEQTAIRVGLLEDHSPNARLKFVLGWGLPSLEAARNAIEQLQPTVDDVVAMIEAEEVIQSAQAVLGRLFLCEARVSAHNGELCALLREFRAMPLTLSEPKAAAMLLELEQWAVKGRVLYQHLLDTVQAACMLCSLTPRDCEAVSHSDES